MNPPRETESPAPAVASVTPDPDDPRVVAAVEEYMAELETGQRPERQAFLARYPEVAPVLAECLDGLQFLHAVTPHLNVPASAGISEELRREPLGDFRIVREVGRGGMGVVYEAVQLSLGRRVALKVLSLAAALDSRQLQRFHNEAQAAAQLHHSNIVPVYAVGSERGVHYYAMQFIEGQSLAALIEQARTANEPRRGANGNGEVATGGADAGTQADGCDPARSQPSLRTGPAPLATRHAVFREVARLTVKAAEALEHAHEVGVVHRDVKPANLLLDDRGNLWVADFGLALFQSDAGLTMTGELLGTLRYMSPEQALGKRGVVDHRTDVYSLGVTLYELLTLRPAFDGQDRQELLAQIALAEPRPPRRINPAIPVELETIVLKASAKNPAERYATAQEMANDLQRFLEYRPVLARRPTLWERTVKWGRRHRSLVTSAVVLLLTAVGGLLTATLLIAREHAETRAAYEREREKAQEAREQRARAEQNFRQARKAVDFLTHIGEQELVGSSAMRGVRRRMLEAALGYYQEFLGQEQDPSSQAELEASRARVAELLEELSALQGAGQLTVLKEPAVQHDLKLSREQRGRVVRLSGEAGKQWGEAFRAFRTLTEEGQRAKSLELARAEERAVADVLEPEQARRFRQILLQLRQRGPYGFSDPDVVEALKLTPEQRGKIRRIRQDASRALGAGGTRWGRGRGGVSWQAVYEKALTVLTAEQRATWRALTGEPIRGEVRFMPPGPSGPRFGPPGGRFGNLPGPPTGFGPPRPR